MNKYVRVTLRIGPQGRRVTLWAEKLGPGHYRKVNSEGDWGFDHVDRRFVVGPNDVVREQAAEISKKYGELEVIK